MRHRSSIWTCPSFLDTPITLPPASARVYFPARQAMQVIDTTQVLNPNSVQGAVTLTIILAFAGYLITFLTSRVSGRRAARLRLVDQRLNDLYGPLYVATVAGNIAYKS